MTQVPGLRLGGPLRDTITRPLTDLPVAGYPLVLQVAVPRYRLVAPACGRAVFHRDLGKLAAPRASPPRLCARYVSRRLMIERNDAVPPRRNNTTSHHRDSPTTCAPSFPKVPVIPPISLL